MVDSLSCTICCEGFNEEQHCPRLLSCGHTFCTGCLERLFANRSAAGSAMICPSCRQEIPALAGGVKGLPKNFALLDVLLASPQHKESPRHCNACESQHEATFWCVDCKENFCQEASTWHTRTKLTAKHRVVSLEELKAHPELLLKGAASSFIICAEHNETFRFYDEQCGQVICRDCVALSHNGHKCCSLAVAAAKCREDIGAVLSQAATRVKQVEEAERVADQVNHNLDQDYEREAGKIRATFQLIRDAVTARESVLLNELKQAHDTKSVTITNQRELLHTSRMCLESAVDRTEAAVESNEDVRLLVSRGDLTAALSSLASLSLLPQTDDRLMFIAAINCPTKLLLGQINSTGGFSVKSISAAHPGTTAAAGWTDRPGERASFPITAHDGTGARHKVGGDTFVVQLQSQQQDEKEEKNKKELPVVLPSPQALPFLLRKAGSPFDPLSCDGFEVTSEGVIKNASREQRYVIGKERFCEGRWKFRTDHAKWVTFGVLKASKAKSSSGIFSPSYSWRGSYSVTPLRPYSNGRAIIASPSFFFRAGDLVTMELKLGTLSVCNLRSGQTVRVERVPAGEYRLHLNLAANAQLTWQE